MWVATGQFLHSQEEALWNANLQRKDLPTYSTPDMSRCEEWKSGDEHSDDVKGNEDWNLETCGERKLISSYLVFWLDINSKLSSLLAFQTKRMSHEHSLNFITLLKL